MAGKVTVITDTSVLINFLVIDKVGLAIDDKTARKRVAALYPAMTVLTTESIVVKLIKSNLLSVTDADAFKAEWEQNHRFRLSFSSFSDLLTP